MIGSAPTAWPLALRMLTACCDRERLTEGENGAVGGLIWMMIGIRSDGYAVISAISAGETFCALAACALAFKGAIGNARASGGSSQRPLRTTSMHFDNTGVPTVEPPDVLAKRQGKARK